MMKKGEDSRFKTETEDKTETEKTMDSPCQFLPSKSFPSPLVAAS